MLRVLEGIVYNFLVSVCVAIVFKLFSASRTLCIDEDGNLQFNDQFLECPIKREESRMSEVIYGQIMHRLVQLHGYKFIYGL